MFLKKPRKDKQLKIKKISQKKSNLIFLTGLSFFVLFGAFSMFVSLSTTAKMKARLSESPVVEARKETDRTLEQFLDGYVSRYFNYDSQAGSSDENISKLNDYYGSVPDVKNQGQTKQEMNLVIGEYTFDEGKLIFYFTANNRLDFRELVKEVNKTFKKRVEFYQIKTNDEGRILSAFGKYGREIYW